MLPIDFALYGQFSVSRVVFMLPIDFAIYGQLSASRVAPNIFALRLGFSEAGSVPSIFNENLEDVEDFDAASNQTPTMEYQGASMQYPEALGDTKELLWNTEKI